METIGAVGAKQKQQSSRMGRINRVCCRLDTAGGALMDDLQRNLLSILRYVDYTEVNPGITGVSQKNPKDWHKDCIVDFQNTRD